MASFLRGSNPHPRRSRHETSKTNLFLRGGAQKSLFRLDEIPSGKKATARCLIFASLIAHLLGRMLAQLLLKKRPWQYSPRKWSQYLLHFTRCIAKAICDADLGALQRVLQEIKRTAPSEIMRGNPYVRGIYGVSSP